MKDDRTSLGWPLPHKENLLTDDVGRIRDAFEQIDTVANEHLNSITVLEEKFKKHHFEQFIGLKIGG